MIGLNVSFSSKTDCEGEAGLVQEVCRFPPRRVS